MRCAQKKQRRAGHLVLIRLENTGECETYQKQLSTEGSNRWAEHSAHSNHAQVLHPRCLPPAITAQGWTLYQGSDWRQSFIKIWTTFETDSDCDGYRTQYSWARLQNQLQKELDALSKTWWLGTLNPRLWRTNPPVGNNRDHLDPGVPDGRLRDQDH